MTHLDETAEPVRGQHRDGRTATRAWTAAVAASMSNPSLHRRELEARWGAAVGMIAGGLLAAVVGEPQWIAAPVLLSLLGWASGRFNSGFRGGTDLGRTLAPALRRQDPAQQ